jgi:ABC-type ATPase with predicted acetyltransferase domain
MLCSMCQFGTAKLWKCPKCEEVLCRHFMWECPKCKERIERREFLKPGWTEKENK